MRQVYACRLELTGESPAADARLARVLTKQWIGQAYGGWPEGSPEQWRPTAGVTVSSRHLADESGDESLTVTTWRRPHPGDPSLRRCTEVLVATEAGDAWVLVRDSIESLDPTILEPVIGAPHRPGIVRAVVEHAHCTDGGWTLAPAPREVGASTAVELDWFLHGGRRLPALVVAPDERGRWHADVDELADLLVGVAHVVVLCDTPALDALASELGAAHVPDAGGARLFWPRWRSTDPPARHRRWHAEDLADASGTPRATTTEAIARTVFEAAALRMPEPPLLARLEAEQARARIHALDRTRHAREQREPREPVPPTQAAEPAAGTTSGTESVFEPDELELWEQDLVELFEARRRIADLESDNERLLQAYLLAAGSETRTKSVADVVSEIRRECRHLLVLPTALESAARVQFARVDELGRELRILDELSGARASKRLGRPFTEECRARGLDWAGGIGEVAQRKHGAAYTVRAEGQTYALAPHLRLQGPDGPLRVYCALEPDRVVVGWVGRHLPDKADPHG